MYYGAKKLFALNRWRKAYTKYMLTAAESDAHRVETLLRVKCGKLGLSVDRGNVRGIPDPKYWSAPAPPPPLPQTKPRTIYGGVKVLP